MSPPTEPCAAVAGARRRAPSPAALRPRRRTSPRSSAKAQPTPTPAMRKPPSAGPARRRATGRMNWSSEFACGSSEAGRTSGTIASNAGPKNAVPAPKTATSSEHVPELERAGEREDGDHADCQPARDVRGEHQAAAVEAVAHDAAQQQEGERRHGHGDADHRERRRRVGERVDLPRQRDDEDAVSQQRDAHPAPQQPEVPQCAAARGGEHG